MIHPDSSLMHKAVVLLAAALFVGDAQTAFADPQDSPCPRAAAGTVTGIQIGSADVGVAPADQIILIRGGASQPVRKGMPLCADDHVTVQGKATLLMSLGENVESSADITLYAFASVELTDPRSIFLRIGKMFATLRGVFQARTTLARLGAKGTEFEVDVTELGIEVTQLEGEVEFQPVGSSAKAETLNPSREKLLLVRYQSPIRPEQQLPPKSSTGPPVNLGRLSRLVFLPGGKGAPRTFEADEELVRQVIDTNATAILRARPLEASKSLIPNFRSNEERARVYREARFRTIWSPEDQRYLQLLGNVYVDWTEAQKALRYYRNAGKIQGGNRGLALYYNNLGNAYRLAGSPKEAEAFFIKARDADSTLAFTYNGWGDVFCDLAQSEYDRGNPGQALEFLDRAAKLYLKSLDPVLQGKEDGQNRAIPNYHLGEVALQRAQWTTESTGSGKTPELAEAQHYFEEALNWAPQYSFGHVGLGRAWSARSSAASKSGKAEESTQYLESARREYRSVIERDSSFAPAHLALGESYEQQGDWKAAAQFFLKATQADPHYPLAYYKTAVALRKAGDEAAARNYFGAFLQVESPLLRTGNRAKEARDAVSKALPSDGGNVVVPPLTGVSLDEAQDRLSHAGLKRGRVHFENSDASKNFIIRQEPQAGTKVNPGTKVNLWRSSGPSLPVEVPSVVGLKSWQASLALGFRGLRMREQEVESDTEKGKIVSQDPPAGAHAVQQSEIVVYVSSGGSGAGTTGILVPNVVGHDAERARKEIESVGLVFELRRGDSPEHSNIVHQQRPDPGAKVPRATKVIVYID